MRRRIVAMAALGALGALGCDGSTAPESNPPPENLLGPDGGTVVVENLTVDVPPGALTAEVEITARRITPASSAAPDGYVVVDGTAFDLGPDGLSFQEPVQLTIGYDAADVPPGFTDGELGILQNDGVVTVLESSVDGNAGVVRASVEHFSDFAIGLQAGPYQRVACPDLSPSSSAGIPLDRVPLGRLPDTFEPPLLARVEVAGEGREEPPHSFALVRVDETSGDAELVVPVHPSASPGGGDARILVTDGTRACAPFEFTVEALPPAPGELGAIADYLQQILDQQAEVLGTTREEIVATPPDDLPPPLLPFMIMQAALDHPENDASLAAIAAGTAAVEDSRLDLLEPLLARSGLTADLAAAVAAGLPSTGGTASRGAADPLRSVSVGLCTPEIIGDDAALLDHCMGLAHDAEVSQHGPTGKLLQDLGDASGAVGLVPGLGTPAGLVGFVTWLVLNEKGKTAALLPSFLTGMNLEVDPAEFDEDEEGTGRWNASVGAANAGWDMGKELLEGVFQAAQIAGTFDKAELAGPEVNSILAYILTNPVAKRLLEGVQEDGVASETFGPVYVTPDEWTEARIAMGTAVALTSHDRYEPRERGTATLAVRTRSNRFGGQQATADESISVEQLQVAISPAEVHLEAGEVQDFNVRVTHSVHPDRVAVDEGVPLQGTVEEIAYVGDGLTVVSYAAPDAPDYDHPDLLTIRHTAETGARGYSDEERNAVATIRFAEITISPRSPCLDYGEARTFTAEVEGLDDETVVWSADIGTIDEETGEYTAPEDVTPGTRATITATSAVEPGIRDEVTVQIGQCDLCTFDLTLSGGITGSASGPARFVGGAGGALQIELDGTVPGSSGAPITAMVLTPEWDGETRSYVITQATAVNADASPGSAQYAEGSSITDCATCGGTLTIDEADPEAVTGSFQVTLFTYSDGPAPENPPPTTARASFRAARDVLLVSDDPYAACVEAWEETGPGPGRR